MTRTGPRAAPAGAHGRSGASDDPQHGEHLATLRARMTRGTSAGLAVLAALMVVVALSGATGAEIVWSWRSGFGVAVVGYQALVAVLPWPRWVRRPAGRVLTAAHLTVSILLVGIGMLVVVTSVAVALLWMFTLTTALAAATRSHVGQLVTYLGTVAVAVATARIGGNVSVAELVVALPALGALALLFGTLSHLYLRALIGESRARADADLTADRALVLSRASRALVDDDPDAVLEEIVETTRCLGYPYSGVYAHDAAAREVHYVAARGLVPELRGARFPDDVGVAGMVLASGDTVVLDDYGNQPTANPAFAALLQVAIGTPIRDRQGRTTGVLVCGRDGSSDVTDVDQQVFELLAAHAGRALQLAEGLRDERRRVAELAELDRLKSDFLATVSHELRTPLTVVCGLSQTLSERWEQLDGPLQRDLLGRIRANAEALDDVIATLLDFGSLEGGRLRIVPVRFDLGEAVRTTAVRLATLLERHELVVEVAPDVTVQGDRRLLDRVVENLLTNAARHTPVGTRVEVRVTAPDDQACVEVADGGEGIPPDELERIGERFFRGGAHETRPTRGMGLGLALAREILELHDSDLEIRSEVGQGTVFAFRVPRVHAAVRGSEDAAG